MKREETRETEPGRIMYYSRRDRPGEGFGKRKVGMHVTVKFYEYEEVEVPGDEFFEAYTYNRCINKTIQEGVIVQITRRINEDYYDYWYKVELDDGTFVWRSHVGIPEDV